MYQIIFEDLALFNIRTPYTEALIFQEGNEIGPSH